MEKAPVSHFSDTKENKEPKKIGDSLIIFTPQGEKLSLKILKVTFSQEEASRLGITASKNIPIYYLDRDTSFMDAGISPDMSHIVMFPISTDYDLRHELIHVVEFSYQPTEELLNFYKKIKEKISESSFEETDGETYNFLKNIHECIADGYNHPWFISALKKEGLYDEFLAVTRYMKILAE